MADEGDECGSGHHARVGGIQLSHDVAHVEGRCLQAHIRQKCIDCLRRDVARPLTVHLPSPHQCQLR